MRYREACIATLAVCLLLSGEQSSIQGASFRFDLTESIDSDFSAFPESIVDLGVAFARVDSATIEIVGTFTPASVTLVTIPEHAGPVVTSDTVNLILRMGEIGTAWIDKSVYAIQELQGQSGAASFELPLKGAGPNTGLVLMPSGDFAPDYHFLLDGRLGIAAGSMHWVASNYQVLEPPRFELTEFVLTVEGAVVPEPGTLSIAILGMTCVWFNPRRRSRL